MVGPTFAFETPHDPYFAVPALTAQSLDTEWLLTNGLGGFAMGSIVGCNTRRYHSVLIASANPPLQRFNTIAAFHEGVLIGDQRFDLDNHEFHAGHGGSVFNPKGWQCLRRFEKNATTARWHYRVKQFNITKTLRLVWKKQIAVLTYRIEPATGSFRSYDLHAEPVTLQIRPLVAMRDFHHHRRADGDHSFGVDVLQPSGALITTSGGGMPPLHLTAERGSFTVAREWWNNFRHRIESDRHQDDIEDLFSPGYFQHTFEDVGRAVTELRLAVSLEPVTFAELDKPDGRVAHLTDLFDHVKKQVKPDVDRDAVEALVVASDDFIVDRKLPASMSTAEASATSSAHTSGGVMKTVIAGYPWFADWGRDTMISLPGLLLCTGRFDEALQTLHVFAAHIKNGLVPNVFDDYGGDPHYNTVDASLWFVHAALEYLRLTQNTEAFQEILAPACKQIISAYADGTDWNIKMQADSLIWAGDENTQLTWMDAKRDGVVFTPRYGKAVEINALWYRGLCGLTDALADSDAKTAAEYKKIAAKVKKNFGPVFWNDNVEHLNDVVNERGPDGACRPNQLLAVSLPASPITITQQKKVMAAVRQRLLTPVGLRTLSPDHFLYKPRITGTMFQRDEAYHNGTVWPWLIGPYVEGYLRAHKFSAAAKDHCREALSGLLGSLREHMGQLHEIYDAEPPHHPDGCPAQAWSVAETLRALILVESK